MLTPTSFARREESSLNALELVGPESLAKELADIVTGPLRSLRDLSARPYAAVLFRVEPRMSGNRSAKGHDGNELQLFTMAFESVIVFLAVH